MDPMIPMCATPHTAPFFFAVNIACVLWNTVAAASNSSIYFRSRRNSRTRRRNKVNGMARHQLSQSPYIAAVSHSLGWWKTVADISREHKMESTLSALFVEHPLPELEALLKGAVARHELTVHFQPQYDLITGRGIGVEALVRWSLPDGEAIPPPVFISIAERTGQIRPLGEWVLHSACDTVGSWHNLGGVAPTLSVNVSTLQIDEAFFGVIERTIEATGFSAQRLELEITESALAADPDMIVDCLERWKELGVSIAVDDFGTGYSSLSYLSRLPVDRLKLDKSFVHRMIYEKKTASIVRSVFALGKEMGMAVLAEGIETERQLDMLKQFGCRQGQGFLMAKPVPASDARALVAMPWGTRLMPVFRPERTSSKGLYAA